MESLTVSEARARLPEILDRVEAGEEITITRHGRPAAVLLRPDTVRVRRGESTIDRAREIGRMLEEARHLPLRRPHDDRRAGGGADRRDPGGPRRPLMDAFDADVLIYAVMPDHPLGRRVRRLFSEVSSRHVGIGSVVLLPEVLAKPLRNGSTRESRRAHGDC